MSFMACALLLQAPAVRFTSPLNSPFVTSQVVIPSKDNDKPGIVVFREPEISDEIYKCLREKLLDAKLVSAIRKVSKNSFTTTPNFDLDGYRKEQRSDYFRNLAIFGSLRLPGEKDETGSEKATTGREDWCDKMKPGEVLVMFDQGFGRGEAKPLEWHPNIAGIILEARIAITLASDEYGSMFGWGTNLINLGSDQPKFVNIKFKARIYDYLGTIDSSVGTRDNFDGLRFEITGQAKIEGKDYRPYEVQIRQDGKTSNWWYKFEPKISSDATDGIATYRSDSKSHAPSAPANHAEPRQGIQSYVAEGSCPFKDWGKINVLRCTEISGFYSHVPTMP